MWFAHRNRRAIDISMRSDAAVPVTRIVRKMSPCNRGKCISIGRLSTRVYPDKGGPAKHAYSISKSENELGFPNHIIACNHGERSCAAQEPWIHLIPVRAPKEAANILCKALFSMSYLLLSTLYGIFVFSKARVKIVHAHSPSIAGISGLIISKILRIPLVYTVHGLCGPKLPWSGSDGNLGHMITEQVVLRQSSLIMTVSEDYRPIIEKIVDDPRIQNVGNGIDTNRFRPAGTKDRREIIRKGLKIAPSEIVLVWVGNFDLREKVEGVIDTIVALEQVLVSSDLSVQLLLAGDGIFKDEIQEFTKTHGLETRIHFWGYIHNTSDILKAADVFILVSHHEGFPNALLEAMATGLPSIVSEVGSVHEMVGDSGLTIPVGDIDALAKAINYMAQSPSVRNRLSKLARTRAQEMFTWENAAIKQISAYWKYVLMIDCEISNIK